MAPQSRAVPVIITRPEPQASRFAHALAKRFGSRMRPIVSPLLTPVFLDPPLPDAAANTLILTSETGARAAARLQAVGAGPWHRAFCVGNRTAEVAAEGGFDPVSADGDADLLFQLLQQHKADAPFLHLRGRESRGDLVNRLREQGIDATEAVVYAQEPAELSATAKAALCGGDPVAVPLFSPRTAALMANALGKIERIAPLRIFALSPAVALELGPTLQAEAHVAEKPTQSQLIHMMSQVLFGA